MNESSSSQPLVSVEPLVSVVIPAYNAAKYLGAAIESLQAQTYQNLHMIIVNDGSKDDTAAVADCLAAQDKRIEVIHKANAGVSAARNDAMRVVKGDLMCFLDSDDTYLPEKVAKQVKFLQDHPELALVYCGNYIGDENLKIVEEPSPNRPPVPFKEAFLYRCWFSPIAPMLRTSLMKKVGFFDANLHGGEDWDYWIRCLEHTDFGYIPEPLGIYRRHPTQSHHNQAMMRRDGFKLIQKHYAKDARLYRLAAGGRHWTFAKRYRYFRQHLPMARELFYFVLNVRNPAKIRFIMKVAD
ncbi:MAG: glycosyltransferase family 2 protein [Trueperaceae bacterium]